MLAGKGTGDGYGDQFPEASSQFPKARPQEPSVKRKVPNIWDIANGIY